MAEVQDQPQAPAPPPGGATSFDDMLGLDKTKQLTSDLTKIYETKTKSDAGLMAGEDKAIARREREMEQARNREAAVVNDLKPWNADEEMAKRSHSPMEEFGSFATIFSIAASAFTHTPATNAMNAAAAYMNAVKAGDEASYNKAFQAFEENSKLAIDRANIEHRQFEEDNKLLDVDMQRWRAAKEASAAKFNDQKKLALLRSGMDSEILNSEISYVKAKEGMADAVDRITESKLKLDYVKSEMAKLPEKERTPQKQMELTRQYETKVAEAKMAGRSMTPQGIALRTFMDEHQNATADEIQAFMQKGRAFRSAQTAAVAKYMEEHPEATSDDIAKFAGGFGAQQKADKDFGTGKQGQQINSLNVAVSHIETLRELGDALGNGNIKRFNEIAQKWSEETGNPAPTNFDEAKKIVGTEIIKALVFGGGGVSDREEMQKEFDRAKSPAAINGALDTAERLLSGQFSGLKLQYEKTTKRQDFEERMSSEALTAFNKHQNKTAKPASVSVGPNTKDDPDGTTYRKDGWLWKKQGDRLVPVEKQ